MGERVVWRAVGRARKSERPAADRDRYGGGDWARFGRGEGAVTDGSVVSAG